MRSTSKRRGPRSVPRLNGALNKATKGTPSQLATGGGRRREVDVCLVGGAGRVGLPLSIVLASRNLRVLVHDIDKKALEVIRAGRMPFLERGAEPMLRKAVASGWLRTTTRPEEVARSKNVVITIGTPVDEFLMPSLRVMIRCFDSLLPFLSEEQLIVLRSTVYPGVTESIAGYVRSKGKNLKIAFCPERIVEGHAIHELQTLPQIVSGTTPEAEEAAARLFSRIAPKIVRLKTLEAELAKLFTNAYRYIQFSVSNQFYMIASAANLDYYRILQGMKQDYPRSQHFPRAGFTAGPCLFKDTIQLASFYRNQFGLGFQAMLVNEGLPQFIVDRLSIQYPLAEMTVGLLGMAFKAESDDPRSSLSYKLKKILAVRARQVLTTDPYVRKDADLLPLEDVLERSQIIVICTPHAAYKDLNYGDKVLVDIWNFLGRGGMIPQRAAAAGN